MSILSQIERIRSNITSAIYEITQKGITPPEGASSDDLAGLIRAIATGGTSSWHDGEGNVTIYSGYSAVDDGHGGLAFYISAYDGAGNVAIGG